MSTLTVSERFVGPPGTANGGYLGGRLAALVGTDAVSVRLRRPTPLGRELQIRRDGSALELLDCEELLVTATAAELDLLGTLTVRQERPVRLDTDHVLLAWRLGREGRRATTASALIGPDGEVCARAQAIWFEVPAASPS